MRELQGEQRGERQEGGKQDNRVERWGAAMGLFELSRGHWRIQCDDAIKALNGVSSTEDTQQMLFLLLYQQQE